MSNTIIRYYLKFCIAMCNRHFSIIISQTREHVKTHCNDRNSPFHFTWQKWTINQ